MSPQNLRREIAKLERSLKAERDSVQRDFLRLALRRARIALAQALRPEVCDGEE